jgi:molecular chaperone DnaJ
MAGGGGRRRGPAPGADAEVRIGLEFAEAVFGCRKEISVRLPATCATCAGRGTAPGTEPVTCVTARVPASCAGSASRCWARS